MRGQGYAPSARSHACQPAGPPTSPPIFACRFAPGFFGLVVNKTAGTLSVTNSCYLKDASGNPITGTFCVIGLCDKEYHTLIESPACAAAGLPNWETYDGSGAYGPMCTAPNATDFPVASPFFDPRGIDVEVRLNESPESILYMLANNQPFPHVSRTSKSFPALPILSCACFPTSTLHRSPCSTVILAPPVAAR